MSGTLEVIGGSKWGDEGKGKVVWWLIQEHLNQGEQVLVARVNGGSNAGHSIVMDDGREFATHLPPSSIFDSRALSIIGPEVFFAPDRCLAEMDGVIKGGFDPNNLWIDPRAPLLFQFHRLLDGVQDDNKTDGNKVETTRQGIGPASVDQRGRVSLRVGLLTGSEEYFVDMLDEVLREKRAVYRYYTDTDNEAFYPDYYRPRFKDWRDRLAERMLDTFDLIQKYLAEDRTVLIEGAQGTLLDVITGDYPFVTSSKTTIPGLLSAAGITPTNVINANCYRAIGVQKAIESRVGAGPFPTRMPEELEDLIRDNTERGTTSGRDRLLGWYNGPASVRSQRYNGYTHLVLTKIDYPYKKGFSLQICESYDLDGQTVKEHPIDARMAANARANYSPKIYEVGCDISGERDFRDLPEDVQNYCRDVTSYYPGAKLFLVGVGRQTSQMIDRGFH